jgi:glutathione peroxidase
MTIKNSIIILAILTLFITLSCSNNTKSENKNMNKTINTDSINISDITVKTIDGKEISLSDYKGKVLLIVNVASKCGYTKQYTGLQALYDKYKSRGFEILGFPCNDFGGQEPGTNEEIKDFCSLNYNVTFPLFDKIKVLGVEKSPLYAKLVKAEPEGDISWNFEKFIIDKNGNVVKRFKSKVKPEDTELTSAIDELLK